MDSRELRHKLVEFFTTLPNMYDRQGRRALVLQAGIDPALLHQIDWAGPSATFFPCLLDTLIAYGTLRDGRHALDALLETARQQVGQDRQAEWDTLLRNIHLLLPAAQQHLLPLEPLPEPGMFVNREQLQAHLTAFFTDVTRKAYVLFNPSPYHHARRSLE